MPAHRLLALLSPMFLLAACSADLSRHAPGGAVDEKHGRFFVDGVALDHHREFVLEGDVFDNLILTSHTGLVDIVAVPGDRFELIIDLYAQHEDDGEVQLIDGQLMAGGKKGPAVVNGIRGRVPDNINVTVMNSTGNVVLTSFRGTDIDLIVDAGTGKVNLIDCNVSTITIDSGTGDVHVQNSKAQAFRFDAATSGLMADACEFVRFQGESGTGDFRFRSSRMHWARFTSSTGDVVLAGSIATEVAATLGTGRVIRRDMTVAQTSGAAQWTAPARPRQAPPEAETQRTRPERSESPIQPRQPEPANEGGQADDSDS